jgi:pentatricopeptide repeat protein
VSEIRAALDDLEQVIIKTVPRRGYMLDLPVNHAGVASPNDDGGLIARLSLLVLPFANLSGDPAQDHIADGITDDLTSDLSRISGSFVIARNTAFTFKGRDIDVKAIGRELGVRFVLEGSVRRLAEVIRINVQLIDVDTGGHVWAERFDCEFANLSMLSDEVTVGLARRLNFSLIDAAARKSRRESPDAVDLILRGRAAYNRPVTVTREMYAEMREHFQSALGLAPSSADALIGLALVDVSEYSIFNTSPAGLVAAEAAVDRALQIEPNHALGHYARAFIYSMTRRIEAARDAALVAISLDRSLVDAYARLAQIENFLGRPQEALAWLGKVRRISPRDRLATYWDGIAANANSLLGNDTETIALCRKAFSIGYRPHYLYLSLISALAHSGQLEEARCVLAEMTAEHPTFASLAGARASGRSDHPAFLKLRERLLQGLEMAGMPPGGCCSKDGSMS